MTFENAKEKLKTYGQEHVLQYFNTLSETEKSSLLQQIDETDFSVTKQIAASQSEQTRGVITPINAMTLQERQMQKPLQKMAWKRSVPVRLLLFYLPVAWEPALDLMIRRECTTSDLRNRFIFLNGSSAIFLMLWISPEHGFICLL